MDHHSRANQSEAHVRGVAQSGVRIANERAVMTLIVTFPGSSNADLARRSGLGPQTTSRILSDLETRQLIKRGQVLRGRRGQPATPVFINPEGAYCIGVELGWRRLDVTLVNLAGEALAAVSHQYDRPDASVVLPLIKAEVTRLADGVPADRRDRLLGVGIAGPATLAHGVGLLGGTQEQQAAWQDVDVRARVAADTGMPAAFYNDGNAACWAEIVAQELPRPANLAYFQINAFVPAGIFTGGTLWEGPTGRGANLGAIIVAGQDGKPTFLYRVASLLALERRIVAGGMAVPAGSPHLWDWDAIEPHGGAWIEEASYALAQAVMSTRAMVELDKVIVDGLLPRHILSRIIDRVRHHVQLLPTPAAPKPPVEMGSLGHAAGAIGAAELPLFRQYFSRGWGLFNA